MDTGLSSMRGISKEAIPALEATVSSLKAIMRDLETAIITGLASPHGKKAIMINRAALIVRPKKPFIDWAARLDPSGIVPDVEGEQTVYLIPSFDSDEDARMILEEVYPKVFKYELWGWHTDESAWPRRRDIETFEEWFAIEMHSVVEDLCDYEIIEEDDE